MTKSFTFVRREGMWRNGGTGPAISVAKLIFFFDARGDLSQWPPVTEIMNLKITITHSISFYLAQ